MRTPRLPAVDWTDAPTDLNGLVRFGEKWNLVSVRVPSRSARAIRPVQDWRSAAAIVESSWNVMAHGDARDKWRGNWRMEWVASTLHTTSKHGVSSITTADAHTSTASSRPYALADLNGLVHFAERRNLVSARVPSHFKRSLPPNGFNERNDVPLKATASTEKIYVF